MIDKKKAREDAYVCRNMRRESRLLQQVRHRNIVQLFEVRPTRCHTIVNAAIRGIGEFTEGRTYGEGTLRQFHCNTGARKQFLLVRQASPLPSFSLPFPPALLSFPHYPFLCPFHPRPLEGGPYSPSLRFPLFPSPFLSYILSLPSLVGRVYCTRFLKLKCIEAVLRLEIDVYIALGPVHFSQGSAAGNGLNVQATDPAVTTGPCRPTLCRYHELLESSFASQFKTSSKVSQ